MTAFDTNKIRRKSMIQTNLSGLLKKVELQNHIFFSGVGGNH